MLRQLPPTITADETPDWLPAGWMVHSSFLKRGRQTKTYTQLTTGKKFGTKDHVLEHIKMEKLREKRESDMEKREACLRAFQERIVAGKERPSWLPDDFDIEHKISSYSGNPYTVYVHKPTGMSTTLKSDVLWLHNTMEDPQDSSLFGGDEKEETVGDRVASRERPSWLPDGWEMEHRIGSYGGNRYTMYVNKSTGFKTHKKKQVLSLHNNTTNQTQVSSSSSDDGEEVEEATCNEIAYMIDESEEDFSENECFEKTSIRSQPERRQKLDSRAKTQCVFEDEEMSSDNEEDKLRKAQMSKEENDSGHARVAEEDQNLHDVVVECDDKAKGLTGTFVIEINVENDEPANDGLVEKDLNKSKTKGVGTRNIEIINIDSDSDSDSSKVVEVKNKSEESLKAQSAAQEEIGDEARRSVPSESLPVNARSSADDNINKMNEPGLNHEENVGSSRKRKYNKKKNSEETCREHQEKESKSIKKKKDIEEPTKKPKGKRPQREKGSPSVAMEEERENIDWPKPNPNFVFEPITNRFRFLEDDSVIREYLEQNFKADSTLPLPDFGLPSFANLVISKDEEEEHESNKKKKSSFDPPPPPCVQVASSSLPSCSYMQHTVAGN